jgi:glucan phosphoethanolaminetransferase (alkaline phosphatase superfamily)
MGFILFELLKVVNPRVALLALVFVAASATIEAVNLFNYIEPLFTLSLPEYSSAFDTAQRQALARGPIKMFGYLFSVSLTFFGVFCALIGMLILRSRFLPAILGLLMILAGVTYWINSFRLFLALPIPYVQWVTLIAELSLALWLLVVGVNEERWRAQAAARAASDRED